MFYLFIILFLTLTYKQKIKQVNMYKCSIGIAKKIEINTYKETVYRELVYRELVKNHDYTNSRFPIPDSIILIFNRLKCL